MPDHQSPITSHGRVVNALTVDVEDYFHVSAFAKVIRPQDWGSYESRIERNTARLLDLFDEHNCKATFFVLGWIAERYPSLVREIAQRGHEVACHGYDHKLIYDQTPEHFRRDTLRAKNLIEDILGASLYGYRAASFSITEQSKWALDIVAEAGFAYDSSVFPIRHDRYGLHGAHNQPHRLKTSNGRELVEFPLTTVSFLGYRFPVAGGGYFRLYPYTLTRGLLRHINQRQGPFVFYLHPWELDANQPRIHAGVISTFRHYQNLSRCEGRLHRLLQDFRFATIQDVLADLDLWNPN